MQPGYNGHMRDTPLEETLTNDKVQFLLAEHIVLRDQEAGFLRDGRTYKTH